MVRQDKEFVKAHHRLVALENTVNAKQNYQQKLDGIESRKGKGTNRDKAKALTDEGRAHLDATQFDKALVCFTTALALDPAPYTYRLRAQIYEQRGRIAEALVDYERALRGNPTNPQSHLDYAQALLLVNRQQDAIPAFEEARRLSELPQPPEFAARAADRVVEINRILAQLTDQRSALQLGH